MSRGNWLNPLSQLIMSMSFQTSNSGAFRSLHCLIYKVLAPFRVRCGTFTILPQAFRFVKYFFDFFQNLFSYPARRSLPLGSLAILPHLPRFVKYFFRFFSKSFSYPTAVAPFARELDYFTTASCFCQAPFSFSSKLFSKAPGRARLSATARLI